MTDRLSLYIHWPFCRSKCPYCDFNSHVAKDAVDHARWRAALLAELCHFAAEMPGRRLDSIFFGGGTPSLMAPDTAAALISAAKQAWTPADDLEVTLEANPTSLEVGRLVDFRAAGVNRLSLGVQSFDETALGLLGRGHSAGEARAAIELAAHTFDRYSFDLIYARPGQTADQWRAELADALALAPSHLSLYQLSIEAGTAFFRDGVAAAGEDAGAELFDLTAEMTESAGLPAYEISNHAKPGHECRHNVLGWQGVDYAGIGPGAHGRITPTAETEAVYQIHAPDRWLAAVEATGHGTAKRTALSVGERREEIIMTGLRLSDGIDRATVDKVAPAFTSDALSRLIAEDFLILDDNGLRTTPSGKLCLNAVLAELLVS
mgnify:CR=1 FL=1